MEIDFLLNEYKYNFISMWWIDYDTEDESYAVDHQTSKYTAIY